MHLRNLFCFGASIASLLSVTSYAQPTTLWEKKLAVNDESTAILDVIASQSNEYIAVGHGGTFDRCVSFTATIQKFDSQGDTLSSQKIICSGQAKAVVEDSNGDFIVAGSTLTNGYYGNFDNIFLAKISSDLSTTQWIKWFGGSADEAAYDVAFSSDGGIVILGTTCSYGVNGSRDIYLIKTDSNGDLLWEKTIGLQGYDDGNSLHIKSNGNIVIAGKTTSQSNKNMDMVWLECDPNGTVLTYKIYGGNGFDEFFDIKPLHDGSGYLLCGTSEVSAYNQDIIIMKIDTAGNRIWQKYYGGSSQDFAYSITVSSDNSAFITGLTKSYGNYNGNLFTAKINPSGSITWSNIYTDYTNGTSATFAPDGNLIIAGYRTETPFRSSVILKIYPDYSFNNYSPNPPSSAYVRPFGHLPVQLVETPLNNFGTKENPVLPGQSINKLLSLRNDFDTLWVNDGTYFEGKQILISLKNVSIKSIHGANSTTINGAYAHQGFELKKPVLLQGFSIVNCDNSGLRDDGFGGGAIFEWGGAIIKNCIIRNNHTCHNGGGIYFHENYGIVTNSLIVNNSSSGNGGNISVQDGRAGCKATNCTIDKPLYGSNVSYDLEYVNCITNDSPDPKFVNPANGDYRLRSDSPYINAGDNAALLFPYDISADTDLDGNPRIQNGTVDCGAYESF